MGLKLSALVTRRGSAPVASLGESDDSAQRLEACDEQVRTQDGQRTCRTEGRESVEHSDAVAGVSALCMRQNVS